MLEKIIRDLKPQMLKVIDFFGQELQKIRTSRASAALVEDIKVNYWGTPTSLKGIAAISNPGPSTLIIKPWDKSILSEIEKALQAAGLGINPVNDGEAIRLTLPSLTQERRQEFVRLLHRKAEEARVALRNLRQEVWDQIKREEKKGILSEDDKYRGEEELNKLIAEFNEQVEKLTKTKENEISQV